jgi:hypothetical protein
LSFKKLDIKIEEKIKIIIYGNVNLMSKEKCPNCDGAGKIKCPKCKGTGQLSDNGSYKTCSMCSGTANATCPTCGGSG